MLPVQIWEKRSKVSIQKILEHLDRINTNIIAIERNQRTQLELMFTQQKAVTNCMNLRDEKLSVQASQANHRMG